jgi:hypothetical protein
MFTIPSAASKLDRWGDRLNHLSQNYDSKRDLSTSMINLSGQHNRTVHLCVPSTKRFPSKQMLPMYLEFISHHLHMGFDHIFLPLSLSWKSHHMKQIVELFDSFIQEGKLSSSLRSYERFILLSLREAEYNLS